MRGEGESSLICQFGRDRDPQVGTQDRKSLRRNAVENAVENAVGHASCERIVAGATNLKLP